MDGSNGKIVGLLERIADGMDELKTEVKELKTEVKELKVDVRALKLEVVKINGRLDNMIDSTGTHHADHERRISALEDQVFKKSG